MSSSESISIEDLVARQTVEDYGAFRDLCRKTPILTPPPNHEADTEDARYEEEQARKALHEDGCPSCYPADLDFPLQNISGEYERVVSYWKSLPGTGYAVLSAQLSDWRSFRGFQKRVRLHYLSRGNFHTFQDKVRDRRRRHGLEGDASLHSNPEKHSRLENWIEFQDYHITIHERLEKAVGDRATLNTAQETLMPGASEIGDAEESGISGERSKASESRLIYHEFLLQWIERQRKAMAAEHASSFVDTRDHNDCGDGPKATRGAPTLDRRKRGSKARSILSPVQPGISKRKSQRRSLRPRKRNVSREVESTTAGSSAIQRTISRMPDRENKLLPRKENTPLRPQKMSKIAKRGSKCKQSVNTDVKSQPTSRHSRLRQRKSSKPARSSVPRFMQQSTPTVFKTCSGRESKRPEKFCPG
ncbi:hypothetical protein MMC24_003034 [Lignoscripta atroalba]|nr:hypothetical protein [Lignoscripta atroalba]